MTLGQSCGNCEGCRVTGGLCLYPRLRDQQSLLRDMCAAALKAIPDPTTAELYSTVLKERLELIGLLREVRQVLDPAGNTSTYSSLKPMANTLVDLKDRAEMIAAVLRDLLERAPTDHEPGCSGKFGEQYRCKCGVSTWLPERDAALKNATGWTLGQFRARVLRDAKGGFNEEIAWELEVLAKEAEGDD